MSDSLQLQKEKAKFYIRYNHNHDSKGRFATGGGGGGGGGAYVSTTTGIEYDLKNREKFAESIQLIDELASEYNTKLQTVKGGSEKSAGSVEISGTVMHLASNDPSVVVHEFGHTLAMENQTKFGLSNDTAFWKDIKKIQRAYKKDTANNTSEWISSYEHSSKGSDEFFAEAFTLATMTKKGMTIPNKYGKGKALDYANKVLDVTDKYFSKNVQRSVDIMKNNLEFRSYSFELNAEENDDHVGVITGRPIVYNSRTNIGLFDEVIEAGALDHADLRDVRFLVNHDTSKIPLARSRNNNENSTMQLMPDEKGLAIRVNLDVQNNTEARNLYSAIKRGDISGMSFMFTVNKDDWADLRSDHPVRHVRSIGSVVEVSAVTFPAYESTEISVRNKQALENARSALDSAKKSLDSELELVKAKSEFYLKVR